MRRPRVAMETYLYIGGPDGAQRCVYIYADTAGVYGAMKNNLLACLVGRQLGARRPTAAIREEEHPKIAHERLLGRSFFCTFFRPQYVRRPKNRNAPAGAMGLDLAY